MLKMENENEVVESQNDDLENEQQEEEFDYSDDNSQEQITYEQAIKWKEDLKKASKKIAELKKEIHDFVRFFENDEKKTIHPLFGELNFTEWIQIHYKHLLLLSK